MKNLRNINNLEDSLLNTLFMGSMMEEASSDRYSKWTRASQLIHPLIRLGAKGRKKNKKKNA